MFVAVYCYLLHLVAVGSAVASDSGAGRVLAYVEQAIDNSVQSSSSLPAVTIAYAQTIDGSIAPHDRSRINISSPEALLLTHSLRARHDAVLVGINTLQGDQPRLTARTLLPGVPLRSAGRQPRPVVLDSRLRVTELQSRDIRVKKPIIFHCIGDADCQTIHTARALVDAVEGELVLCRPDSYGRCDIQHCLQILRDRFGIACVLVEGGAGVLQSVLEQGLANQAVVTVKPCFLGGCRCLTGQLKRGPVQVDNVAVESVGGDVVLYGKFCRV